jgi:transcriptional regulator with XRE-family HTH domain
MISPPAKARTPAKETLRHNVILRRAKAEISQEELAQRSGVSRAWISRIESGTADVGLDVLDRLAIAFDLAVADLLTELDDDAKEVDEDELVRRAAAPRSERIGARSLLDAIDEAAGRSDQQRYSRRGRPPAVRPPA